MPSDNISCKKDLELVRRAQGYGQPFHVRFVECREPQLKVDLSKHSVFRRPTLMNCRRHLEIQWYSQDSTLAFFLCVLFLEHHAASVVIKQYISCEFSRNVKKRRAACGILVPHPGFEPTHWKRRVLTTGLPGKSLKTILQCARSHPTL